MDNQSMLHYTMVVSDAKGFDKIVQNAQSMNLPIKKGRLLGSAKMDTDWKAICLQDPDKHWIEIIYKPVTN